MKGAHKYMIMKGNEDFSAVEIEKVGDKGASMEEFKESVPKDQPRWIVIKLSWEELDCGAMRKITKIVIISYSPDLNTDPVSKMTVPMTVNAIKTKLPEVSLVNQVCDWDHLNMDNFRSWFK